MDPVDPIVGGPEALNQTAPLPPRSNSPLIILLTIFFFLLLGSTGFLAYQNMQMTRQIAELTKPTPSPTPTATPDPTVNWKTYTKDFSGPKNLYISAQIKYPETWTYSRQSEGTADKVITFKDDGGKAAVMLSFSAFDFVNDFYKMQSQRLGPLNVITTNGYQSYRFQNVMGFIDSYYFPLQNNQSGYVVLYLLDKKYEGVFKQILSTFTFTGNQSGSALQTFTNSKIPFTLQYPSQFHILPQSEAGVIPPSTLLTLEANKSFPNSHLTTRDLFQVLTVPNLKTAQTCYIKSIDSSPLTLHTIINNETFYYSAPYHGVAAGTHDTIVEYKAFHGSACYAINLQHFESSDWNDPNDQVLAQAQQSPSFDALQQILSTFKFTQ